MSNSQWHDDQAIGEAALRKMQETDRHAIANFASVTAERDKYLRKAADLSTDVARLRRALELLWDEATDRSRVVAGSVDISRPCRALVEQAIGKGMMPR